MHLLLGGGGMLGTDVGVAAPSDVRVVSMDQRQLDICDSSAVARVLDELKPACVINAAAYTAVDQAETEPDVADLVNGVAVGELGRACATRGIRVVHFSTDYVFSGDQERPYREHDQTGPINAYGRSKRLGEEALLHSRCEHLIIRTQWLFGKNGKSFPRTMWERARRALPTSVVDDQSGRPTYTRDLAVALWRLEQRHATGILHAANQGVTTWYGLASRIFEIAGTSDLLRPCKSADYTTAARRPAHSVLDTSNLERCIGVTPHWTDALDRFIEELRAEE